MRRGEGEEKLSINLFMRANIASCRDFSTMMTIILWFSQHALCRSLFIYLHFPYALMTGWLRCLTKFQLRSFPLPHRLQMKNEMIARGGGGECAWKR
jgi:hypothetical protein